QVRLVAQAALQVRARELPEGTPPPFQLLVDVTADEAAAGLGALPEPDDGDVFLDYEGHPFWRADTGLFFLFGLLTKDRASQWVFEGRWVHTKPEEGVQAKALIEYFAERRLVHPGMHVYHYNHTERSALEAMAAEHGADQEVLQQLVETGLFVDLLTVVRNSFQAGVESYGLKQMELLAGYKRSHDIDKGASAVVEYDKYTHDPVAGIEILVRIAAYNEDDVRATLALRDWLVDQRDHALAWREANIEQDDSKYPEIDEQIAALMEFDLDTPQHLMANLLGYWLREGRANTGQLLARAGKDHVELMADPEAIAELTYVGMTDRHGRSGKALKWPGAIFRFPPQIIGTTLDLAHHPRGIRVCFRVDDAAPGWAEVDSIAPDDGLVTLIWNERCEELGMHPTAVVVNGWVSPLPKPRALSSVAAGLLTDPDAKSVTTALLRADAPSFTPGGGPSNATFTDDLVDVTRWVLSLDRSYVPIQGPPGTGKTYIGAHIVHALVMAGRRVGVTAMSHHAIDNLLTEIVNVFRTKGDLDALCAVRRASTTATPDIPNITRADNNQKCADEAFNLVAGTTWLFAGNDMQAAKVDVLIIDEAGQLGLADALAAASSADNVVLLGDPLQLPQ
ncbi:MAG: TM0106 family RecB-like putative nuclease, partial [Ilumatobacteraceae bacterium]